MKNQSVRLPHKQMQQMVQAEAARLAAQHELGRCVKEYGRRNRAAAFILFGLCILIALLPLSVGLDALFSRDWAVALVCLGLGLLFLLSGRGLFLLASRISYSRAYRYTNGLVLIDCKGTQILRSDALHWRDIAIIWSWVTREYVDETVTVSDGQGGVHPERRTGTATTYHYRLQRQDGSTFGAQFWQGGRVLLFDMRGDILSKHFGTLVENMARPYLLTSFLATYQSGAPVDFGPLLVDQAGLHYQGKTLPWPHFKHVKRGTKELTILQDNAWSAWASIPSIDIPNLNALCHLLSQLTNQPLP